MGQIRIDRSYVNDVGIRGDRTAVFCAVVGLGCSLGIVVTAEGIEPEEQGTVLRAAGCAMARGTCSDGRLLTIGWRSPLVATRRPLREPEALDAFVR